MDPVQTANPPQDNQQGQGVPFGGQTPQPPVPPISMTDPLDTQWGMPPFHFDESEFVIPASTPPAPWATDTSVPFGGTVPAPVVTPVVVNNTPTTTTATTMEAAPIDNTSPFAPRPDLEIEDAKPVETNIQSQTGAEPFATTTWFDLPSFDTTPTSNETNNDAWPFAMPAIEPEVIPATESQPAEATPSFELPSFDSTPATPADNTHDTSFDLPSFDTAAPTTATTEDTTTQTPEIVMPSFDMPSDETNTTDVVMPTTPSFDLPVAETTTDESPVISSSTSDITTEKKEIPTTPTPVEATDSENVISVDTESDTTPVAQPDTESTTPPTSHTEDNTSPIAENYNSFVDKLTKLLDMTKTETVSLVGHHTDDEHISYEFSHDETESVVIKHHDLTAEQSSATHTLSIDHSDGLSVYLDDELLADYSDTSVAVDEQISYYINDKLQKFSLMLDAEYERLNKKSKEDQEKKKKLLADLRAF